MAKRKLPSPCLESNPCHLANSLVAVLRAQGPKETDTEMTQTWSRYATGPLFLRY